MWNLILEWVLFFFHFYEWITIYQHQKKGLLGYHIPAIPSPTARCSKTIRTIFLKLSEICSKQKFSQFKAQIYQWTTISSFWLRIHIVHLQLHCRKKASTIQYGYRKWGTRALVHVFTNTRAWEQQKSNKINKQTKKGRRET